jgi:hypothetical protein
MKAIEFVVHQVMQTGDVSEDGQAVFSFYTSNYCDGETEQALAVISKIWDCDVEVTLTAHMRVRDLFNDMYDMYGLYNQEPYTIDKEDKFRFDALRADCEWIIQQLDKIKVLPPEKKKPDPRMPNFAPRKKK